MDGLVMCGGAGTRLETESEKPLAEIGGRAMVDYVIDALEASDIDDVYAVTSPKAPETEQYVADRVETIDAPGEGYVRDLQYALDERPGDAGDPVLTTAADLPLLAGDAIDTVLDVYDDGSLTVCTPSGLPEALGITVDATFDVDDRSVVPSGVNVVGGDPDDVRVTWDARFAVNVNYPGDAAVAERLLSGPHD